MFGGVTNEDRLVWRRACLRQRRLKNGRIWFGRAKFFRDDDEIHQTRHIQQFDLGSLYVARPIGDDANWPVPWRTMRKTGLLQNLYCCWKHLQGVEAIASIPLRGPVRTFVTAYAKIGKQVGEMVRRIGMNGD